MDQKDHILQMREETDVLVGVVRHAKAFKNERLQKKDAEDADALLDEDLKNL